MDAGLPQNGGGVIERNLRPNRRLSYKSFFLQRGLSLSSSLATSNPVGIASSLNTAVNNNDEISEILPENSILPTPVSLEDSIQKFPLRKRDGSFMQSGGTALSNPQSAFSFSCAKIPSFSENIPPKTINAFPAISSGKRRKIEADLGPPHLPPFVSIEMSVVRQKNQASSWTVARRERTVPAFSSEDRKIFDRLIARANQISPQIHSSSLEFRDLLTKSLRHQPKQDEILTAQKFRFSAFDRADLIERITLPIINLFGRHNETLYIAINILDRYMEKVYLHTYKQKDVLAATCAIIAIKFNEEFEPEIQSTIEADNRLSHITKKDILNMERKVIAALEWIIRPVTPHVLAYKLLDALPLPFSFPLKRYLVHIVERLCLNYYFNRMNLFDKLETYNMLEIMVAAALEYAFSCTFPTRSKDLSLAVRKLLGSDNHDNALHVNSDLNSKFAYFPITYGKPIQLIYNFSATTN